MMGRDDRLVPCPMCAGAGVAVFADYSRHACPLCVTRGRVLSSTARLWFARPPAAMLPAPVVSCPTYGEFCDSLAVLVDEVVVFRVPLERPLTPYERAYLAMNLHPEYGTHDHKEGLELPDAELVAAVYACWSDRAACL